ncbi:TIR-like protein FxsC [Dactylosporangium sp. CS-047395]|uniref:TIR-like protein FxsC n=1 Tax=Dactylosporangium sp. CS-047395 TaxID=3239936 RepID=UPI003D8DE9F4
MTDERPEPAPDAPVFFLSYARAGHSRPEVVQALHSRLSEHVDEMMALPAGRRPGFVDPSPAGGQKWTEELAFAVGHCQVFVPLLSARYFSSEWCAREWDAFARRDVKPQIAGADRGTSVIPVVWNALPPDAGLPEAVARIQRFTPTGPPPDVASAYRDEGMYGLFWIGDPGRGMFEAATWRLAQRVVRAVYERWVEPRVTTDMAALRDDFGAVA